MNDTTKVGIYEKFARDTGIMTLVHIITALRSLILLPIIAKALDAASYGIWAQVTVTLLMVFPLATLGLDYALNRFLPNKTDRREIRELFFSVAATVSGASAVVAAVIFLLRDQIASTLFGDTELATIVTLMAGTLFFRGLASVATNYFRAFRQTKTYATLSIALELGEISLAAFLVLTGHGIQGAVLALLVVRAFVFLVAIGLIIRQVGVGLPRFINLRSYLGFSLPLMTLPLIWWVLSWSDRYLIAVFLDTAQVGIYSAAYIIGSACAIYLGPLTDFMLAALSKLYEEKRLTEVRTILSRSLKKPSTSSLILGILEGNGDSQSFSSIPASRRNFCNSFRASRIGLPPFVSHLCTVDRLTLISRARSSWDNLRIFRRTLIFLPKCSLSSPCSGDSNIDIWHYLPCH